jgi:hypothetical protein
VQPKVSNEDPEEVDISEHFYEPASTRRPNISATPTDDQLRQMMLGFDPSSMPQPPTGTNPFSGFPGMEDTNGMGGPPGEDPMMKMMQQMMSGMGGMSGNGTDSMPAFPGMPSMAPPATDSSANLWRIVHAIFALGLGLYIALTTPFTGSRIDRLASGTSSSSLSPSMIHFFYIFATAEVLLQTSRFFMEKGRIQQGGIMGMIIGFLPEPYKGYLGLGSRYVRIWTTVSADAMVLVFVMGVCAWLRG